MSSDDQVRNTGVQTMRRDSRSATTAVGAALRYGCGGPRGRCGEEVHLLEPCSRAATCGCDMSTLGPKQQAGL